MTVTAGHWTPISAGGPLTFPSLLHCPLLSLRPLPLPHPVWQRAALKRPLSHPSPHAAAPYRSVPPPTTTATSTLLCALFVQVRSLLMSS